LTYKLEAHSRQNVGVECQANDGRKDLTKVLSLLLRYIDYKSFCCLSIYCSVLECDRSSALSDLWPTVKLQLAWTIYPSGAIRNSRVRQVANPPLFRNLLGAPILDPRLACIAVGVVVGALGITLLFDFSDSVTRNEVCIQVTGPTSPDLVRLCIVQAAALQPTRRRTIKVATSGAGSIAFL
jgi:hypothetical protein